MITLFIELNANTDSHIIWNQISEYGVNLTDLGDDYIIIHGTVALCDCFALISIVAQYGNYSATIKSKGSS